MLSKNNHYLNQQKSGRKFEKYSIKKLKVGAASVLVGAGFFFGYHVEASEVTKTESVVNANNEALGDKKINTQTSVESTLNKESRATEQPAVTGVVEEKKVETKISQTLQTAELQEKVSALQTEINRIRSNEQQKSQIEKAEKLVEEAKLLLSSNSTSQTEVDAKAKEISSLTTILKSIKAEAVTKENKNKDSRNGKKMEEGTGFRTGEEATATSATTPTTTATGIAADVVDATETPAVKRPPYTETRVAEGLAKQIAWLDFSDTKNWSNVDIENGNVYLKEGSIYEKEIMPNYRIKLKVKSLKPFQATEIYRKRMEANNATPEEKATFNPNATNGPIDRTDNNPVRITAKAQDQWSEIRDNGINTNGRKTSIIAERLTSNVGVQFEISGTYKGNVVRPAVVMADAESANPGENIVFTTNGSGWQQIIDLKKNYTDAHRYKPLNYYTTDYKRIPDASWGNDVYNTHAILNAGDGNKIVPKFFTSPDQETGGLGTGVFGPGVTAGKYSVPVVLTKNATEVGLYVFSSGAQAAMIGVAPIDEGDAPKTYGEATHTMNTRDGLTGVEVKQPYLGSERPDADTDTPKNWHGDDDTDTADEGINQLLPDSLKGSEGNIIKANISEAGYYTLNVQAHTGGAERAFVRSWLDFNGNGKFDEEEASDIAEITEDGDVTLHFRSKTSKDAGSLLQAGTRVRIATSRDEIENPTGLAFSGEVEDFNAKITHPPKGDKQTTIGNAIIGNNVEKQSTTVHFTPKGKNIYTQDDVDALIDTNVAPIYINNKTKKPITLSEENTYTVIGQGTYKFTPNGKDVDVEFTPAKGFVGKAHGITIRRQDTNKTTTDWGTSDEAITPNVNDVLNTMDGLYIPEVIKPTVEPTVNNAESINLQGFSQKGKPTFTVATSDTPVTASAKHPAKLIDPRTNTVTDSASVDALDQNNNVVGTYRIVPETGEVTFTPNVDFKGSPKPVGISVPVVVAHDKDDNDITVTKEATYAPRVVPVEPFAEAATTSDVQGKQQVSRIVLNTTEEGLNKTQTVNFNRGPQVSTSGEHVELNTETLTLLDASGAETNTVTTDQGVYVLDKVGQTITFTPKKEFVGTATAVNVQIKDMNGTKVKTTYTPTVIEVTPTGKDSATSGPQGLVQTSPIVFNQRDEEDGKTVNFDTGDARVALKPETLRLLNGTDKVTSIKVENVGTYELVNNAITFTPVPTYHGTAEGVTVQVEDENGKVVTKKYVPTVTELVVRSEDKTSTNIQGESQEGTPVFNIPTESNNARVTGHTLVDPSDNREKESVTVAGKGTFTIDGNGKVTFTPLPTFKGDVDPITVKATVTITNAKNESATITKTATYKPIIVSAEIDKAPATSRNLQGLVQTGTPTFTPKTVEVGGVQKTITVQPNSYKLVKGEAESESLPAYKAGTTEQIGTYAINPATGVVTFTPTDKTYTGAVEPVSVQATGSNGVKVQTTYTPEITPVTPTKEPSATTDVQGKKQVSTIVLDRVETDANKDKTVNFNKGAERGNNGEQVELDPNTLTLVNDAGAEVPTLTTADGEYVLDKTNRTITFTPNKNFVGPAKPVKVQIKDVNGTKVETTYTPTVTDVTITPKDKTSEGNLGKTQTGTPEFEVSSPDVHITGYKLLNPTGDTPIEGTEYEDPEQGTYRINPTTGQVTFIPKPGFQGEAKGIKVRATDENGETADAKYTPTVNPFIVIVVDQESKNIQGLPQEETPIFTLPEDASNATITSRKLVDPADPTNTPKDTVTLDGKGTFRIDGNGKVTFTPEPAYTGDVPSITVKATITVTNDKGESATIDSEAHYKPVIVPLELEKSPVKTRNLQGLEQKGTPTFTPKTIEVDGVPKTVSIEPGSYKLVKDNVEVAETTIPAYKKNTTEQIGTYTLNPSTGEVTFTPTDKTYTGEVEPVAVQVTGTNGVKVQTTYTPEITPVTPTKEASETTDVQGKQQVSRIVLDTVETDADKAKTVNFNKGAEQVKLNPDTLTLLDASGSETNRVATDDGEYVLDKVSNTITFTPKKTFTGQAKPVRVQIKDANGTKVETTYTPTVTDVTMSSTDATSSALQGVTQTGRPSFTISSTEVSIVGYKLLNPTGNTPVDGNEVVVPNEGTYRIDPMTGEVTFVPNPGFTGPAAGISILATDANGETATARYTPTVNPLKVTPKDKTSMNIQGEPQDGTPTFTLPAGVTNATVTSRKLVDPADKVEKDTVVISGKGTFTINRNGKVVFTPEPNYADDVPAITVKATITVTNDDNDIAKITSEATYRPIIIPAELEAAPAKTANVQGAEQTGRPEFTPHTEVVNGVEKTVSVQPNSYKLVKDGVEVEGRTTPAYKKNTQEVIGKYTINVETGEVTFTPTDKTYAGKLKPVTVQGKDTNGTEMTTTYTPVITPIVPTAENGTSEGPQGVEQTGSVTFNPGKEPGTENTPVAIDKTKMTLLGTDGTTPVESLEVSKDGKVIGTYTLVKDPNGVPTGEVKFTPTDKSYVGEVPPATVQVQDANGTPAKATYTPTLTEVTPKGTNVGSEGVQGAPQSGTPTFTSGHESVTMTISETNPAKLVDPTTNLPIEGTEIDAKNAAGEKVGLYTIEPATGKVTFTPNPGFTGTPVPATVQAKNSNGTPATATYTPVVKEAVPSGDSQVSSGIQGAPQTATPVFTPGKNTVNGQDVSVPFEATSKAKLIDPSKTGEEAEVTRLVVENQGTYTIDDNGVVTFTPLPTFKGEATEVSIVRKDKNGTPATAKYKPTVVGVTPSATVASTTKVQGATQEVTVSFTPGKATIGTEEKTVPMDPTAYKLLGGENGTTPLDKVPAMSEDGTKEVGTYTIKVVDGQPVVTFTPTDKTYAGKLKPVTVQGKDTNGTEMTTTYTPVITPIVPTAENGTSEGPQGVEQTGSVTFNPGKEPGTENTPVAIDKTKMTLLGTDGTTPVESLEVSKDGKVIGTYTLVKDPNGVPTGEVKFTPTDKSYVGEVPPATVQVQDANGTPAKATYKPTLTKVTPTGKDTTSTGLQGKAQTGTPTFTPGTPEVPMDDESPATFEDGNNTKTIDKVGTYTVAKDGTVTFTPDKDFVGEAPEVTIKRVDKNGTAVTAKYKAIVAKVLPTGEGSETEGAKGKPQTSTVVFDKKDEDKSTVNFNKGDETVGLNPSTLTLIDKNGNPSTEVKVPGEGTYTLANNVITFTPEKDFAGKATGVTVQVKDINGTPLEKTYTPTVRPVTTFVDPAGNVITVDKNNKPVEGEVDGSKQPTKDIYGYKFVRTETDNKGNTKHIYEQAEGKSVKVTYVSTTNETLSDSQIVETKDKFIGTDYDASIEALKLERIEKDGKVYLLKERKSDSATENGKLSDKEQTVTYVYEEVQEPASNQKYGNVVVVYKDKFGRPISGTTDSGKEVASTVIDTPNSPLTTKYDTTDHKPQTITTKDGKKYKLIKVLKSSDAEKSGVKARTSVITYVYESLDNTTEYPEAHIGLVLVNYLDEEGNPISGKTPEGKVVPNIVVDTEADLVGKDYDTTDHKVSTIIVENGDVYELLKVSETSVEKGKLTEGTINVDYIYHKVVTKFVDENGKEIKSPEKGRTDKKDIPEYTFKETKKDVNGNTVHVYTKKSSSTPSTPSKEKDSLTIWKDGDGNNIKSPEQGKKEPLTIDGYIYERSEVDKEGNTVHIYRKVSSETPVVNEKETLFLDANGKPLQPAKKGQHPHETIPGYEFVRTETDANGNVRHVYRPVAQSQATVNPSPTVEQRKNELPNTGTGDEFAIFGAAAASILAGLGIAIPGKKKEEEK